MSNTLHEPNVTSRVVQMNQVTKVKHLFYQVLAAEVAQVRIRLIPTFVSWKKRWTKTVFTSIFIYTVRHNVYIRWQKRFNRSPTKFVVPYWDYLFVTKRLFDIKYTSFYYSPHFYIIPYTTLCRVFNLWLFLLSL